MKSEFLKKEIRYDGRQLSSHFAYKTAGLAGDSIVAFTGPVDVKLTEMVDMEDVLKNEPIASDRMLNFIVEVFDLELTGTICLQRLLTAIAQDELNRRLMAYAVVRNGDDLFYSNRKLSVSIATASPVSTMIHFALNISPKGAPIEISCLEEMKVDYAEFGEAILKRFREEAEDIQFARVKVKGID